MVICLASLSGCIFNQFSMPFGQKGTYYMALGLEAGWERPGSPKASCSIAKMTRRI